MEIQKYKYTDLVLFLDFFSCDTIWPTGAIIKCVLSMYIYFACKPSSPALVWMYLLFRFSCCPSYPPSSYLPLKVLLPHKKWPWFSALTRSPTEPAHLYRIMKSPVLFFSFWSFSSFSLYLLVIFPSIFSISSLLTRSPTEPAHLYRIMKSSGAP